MRYRAPGLEHPARAEASVDQAAAMTAEAVVAAGPFAGCGDALGAGGDPSSNAALFQAVQKLGLKLQQKKALFDTIIVDRMEKAPTEN